MTDSLGATPEAYFVNVAVMVFDEFFLKLGAKREYLSSASTVRYSSEPWFAEILYLPFDGPNYSPRVEIGSLPRQFVDPRRNRVDIMHTAPPSSEERAYNLRWTYRSRDELQSVLIAVRDRIIRVYALPFLQDTSRLQVLLEQRNESVEAAWTEEIDEHNDSIARANAEMAFRSRDFESAIRHYEMIAAERRSPIDQSKLSLARRRVR